MNIQEQQYWIDKFKEGIQLYDCDNGKIFNIYQYKEEEDKYYDKWCLDSENFSYLFLEDINFNQITG